MKSRQRTNPFMPQTPLQKAMRDYAIWLHMLTEGEDVSDGLVVLNTMARTMQAARQSKILAAALVAIEAAQARGTWQTKDLPIMESALTIIERDYPALPRDVAARAIAEALA